MGQKKTDLELSSQIFQVEGMHCKSCEVLVEDSLGQCEKIKSAQASSIDGTVKVEFSKDQNPSIKELNQRLEKHGYTITKKHDSKSQTQIRTKEILIGFCIIGFILLFFALIQNLQILSSLDLNSGSSIGLYFLYGAIAGASTCAALVGAVIFAAAKNWQSTYTQNDTPQQRVKPHVLFHLGRLMGFTLCGGMLAVFGSFLQGIIRGVSVYILIFASVLMFISGLEMLGVKFLRSLKITLPKKFGNLALDKSKQSAGTFPFVLGLLSFLIPCGITLTVMFAVVSTTLVDKGVFANFLLGAAKMFLFALGTLVFLLPISLSSLKFGERKKYRNVFNFVSGVILLLVALATFNSILVTLGSPITLGRLWKNEKVINLVNINSGRQVIEMEVYSFKFVPNYFVVKKGIPVTWEITNRGASGCSNAIISKQIFGEEEISLRETSVGDTVLRTFTIDEPGKYSFSCWMGMITGTIEVIEK
jgi:uncharacterized protein